MATAPTLTRAAVAKLLGVRPATVSTLVTRRRLTRSAGHAFTIEDVAVFARSREEGAATPADLRLAKARADKVERQLQDRLDQQLPAPAAAATWQALAAACTARLRLLPTDTAPALAAEDQHIRVEALLRDAVYVALAELADADAEAMATAIAGKPPAAAKDTGPATAARTLADHRDRVAAARAGMIEADERLKRGDDRPYREVVAEFLQRMGNMRQALLALPTKQAPMIAVESKPAKVVSIIRDEIEAAVRELAA